MQMRKCGRYITFGLALEEYKKLLEDKKFFKPDMYIFLYTNEEIRNQRNLCRNKSLSKSWLNSEFIYYQNEFYKRVSKNIKNKLEIDTTEKKASYVSECIMKILGGKTHIEHELLDI